MTVWWSCMNVASFDSKGRKKIGHLELVFCFFKDLYFAERKQHTSAVKKVTQDILWPARSLSGANLRGF